MRTAACLASTALLLGLVLAAAPATLAQTGAEHTQHHPAGQTPGPAEAAPQAPPAAAPSPPMPGPPGMGTGSDMMGPGMMRMMEGGMPPGPMTMHPMPGITIIINAHGMPITSGPMMGGRDGGAAMGMGSMGMMGQREPGGAAAAAPSATALRMAAMRMHQAMNVPLTGDPEADFARAMIPHHQGAIEMARITLERATDPEIRKLAQDVIAAQEGGIASLRGWLAKNPGR